MKTTLTRAYAKHLPSRLPINIHDGDPPLSTIMRGLRKVRTPLATTTCDYHPQLSPTATFTTTTRHFRPLLRPFCATYMKSDISPPPQLIRIAKPPREPTQNLVPSPQTQYYVASRAFPHVDPLYIIGYADR